MVDFFNFFNPILYLSSFLTIDLPYVERLLELRFVAGVANDCVAKTLNFPRSNVYFPLHQDPVELHPGDQEPEPHKPSPLSSSSLLV